jgi:hypothetical protein
MSFQRYPPEPGGGGGGTQWHAGEDLSRVVGRVGLEPTTQGL